MRLLIELITLTFCLSTSSDLRAMDIRQMTYTFNMEMVQDITGETFVITNSLNSPGANTPPTKPCSIPAVHFPLNSTHLSSREADIILAGFEKCRTSHNKPLVAKGFTCSLGPDQFNQTLSLQRAKAVAGFLRNHGFTVGSVQGKGSQYPITLSPRNLFKNRRVEIEPAH